MFPDRLLRPQPEQASCPFNIITVKTAEFCAVKYRRFYITGWQVSHLKLSGSEEVKSFGFKLNM
jgi:hypothetical protein